MGLILKATGLRPHLYGMLTSTVTRGANVKLAKEGVPAPDLDKLMQEMAQEDLPWKERLAAGVSYPAGDDVLQVAQQAYLDCRIETAPPTVPASPPSSQGLRCPVPPSRFLESGTPSFLSHCQYSRGTNPAEARLAPDW